jgi:hypothetical protein
MEIVTFDETAAYFALPIELIVQIFSFLSPYNLGIVERVCKRWRALAQYAWLAKRRYRLDDETNRIKRINFNALISKSPNLRVIDFGGFYFNLRTIHSLTKIARHCVHLSDVSLRYESVRDEQLTTLFVNCAHLHKLNLIDCDEITGECLRHAQNMTHLVLNYCSRIVDMRYVHEFLANNSVTLVQFHFLLYNYDCSPAIIKYLANIPNLSMVSLSMSDIEGIDELSTNSKLERLDLSRSRMKNNIHKLSQLLNKSTSITHLVMYSTGDVSDRLFTLNPIKAPLVYLDLSDCDMLTDAALEAIVTYASETLRTLKLCSCTGLSAKAVVESAKRLPGLLHLDLSYLTHEFKVGHLMTVLNVYESWSWQVSVTYMLNCRQRRFYKTLLRKLKFRTPLVKEGFPDILYKNLKIVLHKICE